MKAQRNWVDHPEAQVQPAQRPQLRLIVSPPESPPETPSQKAVESISVTTEIFLTVFAQGILIGGLFLASSWFN